MNFRLLPILSRDLLGQSFVWKILFELRLLHILIGKRRGGLGGDRLRRRLLPDNCFIPSFLRLNLLIVQTHQPTLSLSLSKYLDQKINGKLNYLW